MTPYVDTNFLTRVYVELAETPAALTLLEKARDESSAALPITWLHCVELGNALQFHVFAGRSGQQRVTPEQAAAAWAGFREDLDGDSFIARQPFDLDALEQAVEELSLRHTARHGFRVYDLLHVASALAFGCDTFWSFDLKARKLAALEGLALHQ